MENVDEMMRQAGDASQLRLWASFGEIPMPMKLIPLASIAVVALSLISLAQTPAVLTASDGISGGLLGQSVGISGNTIVAGSGGARAAYIFVKPATGWSTMTQTAKLTASDSVPGDEFGSSVAISGNTIVVTAPNATVNGIVGAGAGYVFIKPPTGWVDMTETAKLTGSGTDLLKLGFSAATYGNTIVLGADNTVNGNANQGSAYVYVKPATGWKSTTQTAMLTASDGGPSQYFGMSVAIQGNTVAVVGNGGEGYVFVEPATGWIDMNETARLTSSISDALLGSSVSFSGNTIATGSQNDGQSNTAFVFVEPSGGWANMTQTAELLIPSHGANFGSSVSINGSNIVGGAPGYNTFSGEAFVFVKPPGGWKNTSQYKYKDVVTFSLNRDEMGFSVGVNGGTVVVGAINAPESLPCGRGGICTPGPGQVFVYPNQ
jgi:hypothetical protein